MKKEETNLMFSVLFPCVILSFLQQIIQHLDSLLEFLLLCQHGVYREFQLLNLCQVFTELDCMLYCFLKKIVWLFRDRCKVRCPADVRDFCSCLTIVEQHLFKIAMFRRYQSKNVKSVMLRWNVEMIGMLYYYVMNIIYLVQESNIIIKLDDKCNIALLASVLVHYSSTFQTTSLDNPAHLACNHGNMEKFTDIYICP